MNKLIAETWKDEMHVDSVEVFYGLPQNLTWARFLSIIAQSTRLNFDDVSSIDCILEWRFLKGGEDSQLFIDDWRIKFIWTQDGEDDKVIAELMQERNRIMQEISDTLKRNEQLVKQILDKQRAQSHSEKN